MKKIKLIFSSIVIFNLIAVNSNAIEINNKDIEINNKSIKIPSNLKTLNLKGFTIILNFDSTKHDETKYALTLLEQKLDNITKIVKPKQLNILKGVPIWVEWELKDNQAMCYHVSKDWLISNGYPSEKEKSVEISNLKKFVSWQKLNQPFMVLHEFAHAYHDKALGFDNSKVLNAYQNAVESKKYENVDYNLGGKKRSYALTNEKEYFAELTEAYLGENDFYPYNKAQLKEFDPIGYRLMQNAWD